MQKFDGIPVGVGIVELGPTGFGLGMPGRFETPNVNVLDGLAGEEQVFGLFGLKFGTGSETTKFGVLVSVDRDVIEQVRVVVMFAVALVVSGVETTKGILLWWLRGWRPGIVGGFQCAEVHGE